MVKPINSNFQFDIDESNSPDNAFILFIVNNSDIPGGSEVELALMVDQKGPQTYILDSDNGIVRRATMVEIDSDPTNPGVLQPGECIAASYNIDDDGYYFNWNLKNNLCYGAFGDFSEAPRRTTWAGVRQDVGLGGWEWVISNDVDQDQQL